MLTQSHILAVHPGEVLRAEVLEPLHMSAYRLAQHLRVPQQRIADVVAGKRGVSADTALRLGRFLTGDARGGARFWMNLQVDYELRRAAEKADDELDEIVPRSTHDALDLAEANVAAAPTLVAKRASDDSH